MKILVVGATGSIGRLTVGKLLEQGHEVIAFARHPERLNLENDKLRLVAGDVTQFSDVSKAVADADAVVLTLGAGMSRSSKVRSEGTMTVIKAMQAHGVRRLICQSTLGARESWGNLNFFWKRIMFGALLKPMFLDHELQERLVEASGLDWTIVRPSAFTDEAESGAFMEDFGAQVRLPKLTISRSDVAAFLVGQLDQSSYLRRAVGISN